MPRLASAARMPSAPDWLKDWSSKPPESETMQALKSVASPPPAVSVAVSSSPPSVSVLVSVASPVLPPGVSSSGASPHAASTIAAAAEAPANFIIRTGSPSKVDE
jgi:hypothetical protein